MSDISIPGVASKYNTSKLINDLVEAERIRLTNMEDDISSLEVTKTTWRQVNRNLGNLQRSVKSLYGFENPFSEKIAESSNERILTASATRTAPFDEYSITVRQIATSDRFLTPSLDRSFRVESGNYTFQVGEETISLRYRGGTISDFASRLSAKGEGLIRATTVRDTPDTQVLMIEAVPTGAKNRLIFSEDAQVLGLQTGMMRESRSSEESVSLNNAFDNATEGSTELSEDGLLVKPQSTLRLPFDETVIPEEGMILEYRYRTVEYSEEELTPSMPPGPSWPDVPGGEYQGLEINSIPNSFALPDGGEWSPPERVDNPDVLRVEGSGGIFNLPPLNPSEDFKLVQIDINQLPENLSAIVLDNRNTHRGIQITDIRLYDPMKQGNLEPSNPVGTAGDALIEFRGIEARRPTNSIDDLVDGLTINLKRPSSEPVDLTITPDVETAKDGIIKFVYNYNQLLTKILVLTSEDPGLIDELEYLTDDERKELEDQMGSLRGDISLNQMKNRLKTIVSNPYPTREGADLSLLAQIGVSTNASSGNSGGALNFSKLRGYLEIDEEKLDSLMEKNIGAVKDLFGKDTSGDLVINSGVAQAIDQYLTPYTQTGGFVSNRISRIDGQIDSTEDDISDYEKHLEDYEADLKRQYGTMEAT
ncbi:MAG: flagellar filament capping protein FliD, partial [Spirochaetaceae bacterium]|nr:flagellar filament capping protein FliD [Spirochaetaceae bacterium]